MRITRDRLVLRGTCSWKVTLISLGQLLHRFPPSPIPENQNVVFWRVKDLCVREPDGTVEIWRRSPDGWRLIEPPKNIVEPKVSKSKS